MTPMRVILGRAGPIFPEIAAPKTPVCRHSTAAFGAIAVLQYPTFIPILPPILHPVKTNPAKIPGSAQPKTSLTTP